MTRMFTDLMLYTKGFKQSLKKTATQYTIRFIDGAGTYFYENIWWIFREQIYAIQFHLQYAYFQWVA